MIMPPKSNSDDGNFWETCVNILITLVENILLDENSNPISPSKFGIVTGDRSKAVKDESALSMVSMEIEQSLPQKRKCDYDMSSNAESKSRRISNSLANEVARSLKVTSETYSSSDENDSMTDATPEFVSSRKLRRIRSRDAKRFRRLSNENSDWTNDMSTPSYSATLPDSVQTNPSDSMTSSLRRLSFSSFGPFQTSIETWFEFQAASQGISVATYKVEFQEKVEQLRSQLQVFENHPTQQWRTYEFIKSAMENVVKLAQWLSGNNSKSIGDVFPQWHLVEPTLKSVAEYIQANEDMKVLVSSTFHRSADLASDLKRMQDMLELKRSQYGDILAQNGLRWKVIGLPVQEDLLIAVKKWFYSLCLKYLAEVHEELQNLQSFVTSIDENAQMEVKKLMDLILLVLEFTSNCVGFVGFPSEELSTASITLATVYIQWTTSEVKNLLVAPQQRPHSHSKPHRLDVRFMHHMENVIRIILFLRNCREANAPTYSPSDDSFDFDFNANISSSHEDSESTEQLSTALLDLGVIATTIAQTIHAKSLGGVMGAMIGATRSLNVYAFLLRFVSRVVEYSGLGRRESFRMQRLFTSFEQLENAVPS